MCCRWLLLLRSWDRLSWMFTFGCERLPRWPEVTCEPRSGRVFLSPPVINAALRGRSSQIKNKVQPSTRLFPWIKATCFSSSSSFPLTVGVSGRQEPARQQLLEPNRHRRRNSVASHFTSADEKLNVVGKLAGVREGLVWNDAKKPSHSSSPVSARLWFHLWETQSITLVWLVKLDGRKTFKVQLAQSKLLTLLTGFS